MTEHYLKTFPEFWDAVTRGDKTFEIRWDDRDFQLGDVLILERWSPETGYSAKDGQRLRLRCWVSFVLPGDQFGIERGYVMLGLHHCPPYQQNHD